MLPELDDPEIREVIHPLFRLGQLEALLDRKRLNNGPEMGKS